jgi:hypothetical protein
MLDILQCLEKRKRMSPFSIEKDEWLEEILRSPKKDAVFFITLEGLFLQETNCEQISRFRSYYHLAGEFSLGRPYISSESHYSLIYAVPHKTDKYKTSVFNGITYESKTMVGCSHALVSPAKYKDEFLRYIHGIEEWINNEVLPQNDENWRFEYNETTLRSGDTITSPRKYSRKYAEIHKLLKDESVITMSQVADVLRPNELSDDHGRTTVLTIDEQRPYQYNSAEFVYGPKTDVKIQYGDILYPRNAVDAKPYFVGEHFDTEIYASPEHFVIRCHNILPQYLWLYLTSDVSICILEIMKENKLVRMVSEGDLEDFPVILPKLSEDYYIRICETLNDETSRHYDAIKQISYQDLSEERAVSVGDILSTELVMNVRMYQQAQLKTLLISDMQELNACFKAKAYKATLILAGSILEAVLIDWLSEIKGKDYFSEEFMVRDQYTNKMKRADLIDYINEIKYIKRPDWAVQAQEAHSIRKKRNLVHAKLCINSDEVNETVCRQVIDYLQDVLRTRGI